MAKAKEKFPKMLYVAKENEGTDDEYLIADASPSGMQVQDDERIVAVYQFLRMVKVVNKTEVS